MRMPMDSSELDQMVRFTPSHVGSCVLVMALSSMVLKIEHIVALRGVSGGSPRWTVKFLLTEYSAGRRSGYPIVFDCSTGRAKDRSEVQPCTPRR